MNRKGDNIQGNIGKAEKIAKMGVFIALAMIFSYVEALFPFSIGIPGIKMGIANLVVVVGLYFFGAKEVFLISIIRIILMGILFGNGATLRYSMAGGLCSFVVMLLAYKLSKLSVVGVSILGAVFHNCGQIFAAVMILDHIRIIIYLPVLLVAGVVTGLLIGIGAERIIHILSNNKKE